MLTFFYFRALLERGIYMLGASHFCIWMSFFGLLSIFLPFNTSITTSCFTSTFILNNSPGCLTQALWGSEGLRRSTKCLSYLSKHISCHQPMHFAYGFLKVIEFKCKHFYNLIYWIQSKLWYLAFPHENAEHLRIHRLHHILKFESIAERPTLCALDRSRNVADLNQYYSPLEYILLILALKYCQCFGKWTQHSIRGSTVVLLHVLHWMNCCLCPVCS